MDQCPVQSGHCSFCSCQKEVVEHSEQVVFIKLQIWDWLEFSGERPVNLEDSRR